MKEGARPSCRGLRARRPTWHGTSCSFPASASASALQISGPRRPGEFGRRPQKGICEALIEAGFLLRADEDDRRKVGAALGRMIETMFEVEDVANGKS